MRVILHDVLQLHLDSMQVQSCLNFLKKKIAKKTFSYYFHLKSGFPYYSQYTFAFSGVWEISEFSDKQLNFFPFFPPPFFFSSSFLFLIIFFVIQDM